MAGTLFVVATPIGNLEDITFRAVRVLSEVDLIASEDTRETKKLLTKYGISKPLISYHAQSQRSRVMDIIEMLREGKNIAIVSCAGTPGISDPGTEMVSLARKEHGVRVVAVPGPSAVISALSISGFPTDEFVFLGFLPHKKGRATLFKRMTEEKRTVVFYESPHRFLKALDSLKEYCPERQIGVAREMTKVYEDFVSGTPEALIEYFSKNPDQVRGEFAILVSGK